jgi:hypothetical protein
VRVGTGRWSSSVVVVRGKNNRPRFVATVRVCSHVHENAMGTACLCICCVIVGLCRGGGDLESMRCEAAVVSSCLWGGGVAAEWMDQLLQELWVADNPAGRPSNTHTH